MSLTKAVKNQLTQPFLKWAGGKRQLLPEIRKYIPDEFDTYFEPFVGAGAVLFDLQPEKAVISDKNSELINVYHVIKNEIDDLIKELQKHEDGNHAEYFYEIRSKDRDPGYDELSPAERAARIIYLNKTCFNGLFRVNSKGYFNVPFGRYKNPKIVNEDVLRSVHAYLHSNNVIILEQDFTETVAGAKAGDFVYFDPPYDPLSDTSSFTSYSLDGFRKEDQLRLRDLCVELDQKGIKFLLSNSATDFIIQIYAEKGFMIEKVTALRNINSVASKRGKIEEVLVRNYGENR
jgi:DNA adenine methylase